MRDYGKIVPAFWTGETGRWIQDQGKECTISALYLMTCPNANMIGLYYLPLATMAYETRLSMDEARTSMALLSTAPQEAPSKPLRSPFEGGFSWFDEAVAVVWLPQMAKYQIGPSLEPKDNKIKAIKREAERWVKHRFFDGFHALYDEVYHLGLAKPLRRGFEAPSKPLRSQEQDQEQKHDKEQEHFLATAASPPLREFFSGKVGEVEVSLPPPSPKTPCVVQGSRPLEAQVPLAPQAGLPGLLPAAPPDESRKRTGKALAARKDAPPTRKTWEAYANAHAKRYGVLPIPNAKVNGQLAQLVKDMGADEAPKIAEYYMTRNASFYVTQHHPIGLLLRDAQGLRVEMLTGQTVNAETARNEERTAANPAAELLADLRRKKS